MSLPYHIPVLLHPSVDALAIRPDGIYVDCTFGGGGHSREILSRLGPDGRLFGFDRDPDALANVPDDPRFTLLQYDFGLIRETLATQGVTQVHGILADLGVSSHQFDTPNRGFSFRFEGPLDMRMDTRKGITAAGVLNEYEENELITLFRVYGELTQAKAVARAIIAHRANQAFTYTNDLVRAASGFAPKQKHAQYMAQVFQALRIEVNGELASVETLLQDAVYLLAPGGRIAVIAYHSLEDRLVKYYFRSGNVNGEVEKDFYGNPLTPWAMITRSAIAPDETEIAKNPRARSARLRIAEKPEA